MNEFLPIGSVILLKGAQKRLMIIGRFQVAMESETVYDYSGCLYPEGVLNPKDIYLFQHEDIERIFFVGMQDEEEFAFRKFMVEEIRKQAEKQKMEQENE